jgi:hypothetical protein
VDQIWFASPEKEGRKDDKRGVSANILLDKEGKKTQKR